MKNSEQRVIPNSIVLKYKSTYYIFYTVYDHNCVFLRVIFNCKSERSLA